MCWNGDHDGELVHSVVINGKMRNNRQFAVRLMYRLVNRHMDPPDTEDTAVENVHKSNRDTWNDADFRRAIDFI